MSEMRTVPVQSWTVEPPGHGPSIVTGVQVGENLTALVVQGFDVQTGKVSQYTTVFDKAWIRGVTGA